MPLLSVTSPICLYPAHQIVTEVYLHMRYDKTDCALMVQPAKAAGTATASPGHGDFMEAFLQR